MAHRGVLRDLCWASQRLRQPHLINGKTEALGRPLVQASAKVRVRTGGGVSWLRGAGADSATLFPWQPGLTTPLPEAALSPSPQPATPQWGSPPVLSWVTAPGRTKGT